MRQWPHSPSRLVCSPGTYMVTAGTLNRERLFVSEEQLAFVEEQLLALACEFGWQVEAWAVFSNHYHFVGRSPDEGSNLRHFTSKLHSVTARWLNQQTGHPGRKVWFSYWQTRLSFEKSYLARLNYVHKNAVHHKLVDEARMYPFCSADWFYSLADPAWFGVVDSFPIDRVNVEDDFGP